MRTATLRQSGGSVILALPKPVLDQLGLKADTPVDIDVVDGKIVVARRSPGRIGLAARLALCDATLPMTAEERDWLDAPIVGEEGI
jgi:antitoxin ChpS